MTTTRAASAVDESRIDDLLAQMTLEEKVSLLAGASMWLTVPIERLNIPAIKVTDGPNGARGAGSLLGSVKAASFPVGIALAATWNTDLIEQIGVALAHEARSKGARVLLAPTVNIHRSPLNGRNFECYSEDPYLTSRIATAYITGVQSQGVGATIKHFVGNESEYERMTISSEIDERTLREIYLPPFAAAVRANVWAIMSSYNKLNGTYTGEHTWLLRELLKGEWRFDGIVMSDWFATHSTADAANNGLDLEMPGPTQWRGAKLVAAVESGEVSQDAIDDSARRMLRLIDRVGAFDDPTIPDEQAHDRPEDRALIRRAAAEGTVLLRNDGVLPLDPAQINQLAIIGPNARTAQIMGGGSAQVDAHYRVTPYDGIVARAGDELETSYAIGCTNHKMLPLLDPAGEISIEYFNTSDLSGAAVWHTTLAKAEIMWLDTIGPNVDRNRFSARITTPFSAAADGAYEFSLASAGLSRLFVDDQLVVDNWTNWQPGDTYFGAGSNEIVGTVQLQAGHTYTVRVEYAHTADGPMNLAALRIGATLPLGDEAIEQAVALAAAADVALLFVGLTGEWETEGHDRADMRLAGRQDELVQRVAAANPRTVVVLQTGSPVAMPWLEDVAAVIEAWYPGQECGNAIADVLFGDVDPAGRLPQTFPVRLEDNPAFINYPGENGRVRYGEGIYVGYRYYEKKDVAPLFPFGFGLSYTSFEYSNLRLSSTALHPDNTLTISVDVSNVGSRDGQDVVQIYVRDVAARVSRPHKELKGFAKVALQSGETTTVQIDLDKHAFAYWDDAQHTWLAEAGTFEILVGGSSQDIRAQAEFELTETIRFGGPAAER